jgi:hypothetical protein
MNRRVGAGAGGQGSICHGRLCPGEVLHANVMRVEIVAHALLSPFHACHGCVHTMPGTSTKLCCTQESHGVHPHLPRQLLASRPLSVSIQEHQLGTEALPRCARASALAITLPFPCHSPAIPFPCAGPATGYCTHDPPCLAPGAQYQGNLRLWAAARIQGYLNPNQNSYMGPANQWDAEQQWLFDNVVETLVVHLH